MFLSIIQLLDIASDLLDCVLTLLCLLFDVPDTTKQLLNGFMGLERGDDENIIIIFNNNYTLHVALNRASLNGHNFSSVGPITFIL